MAEATISVENYGFYDQLVDGDELYEYTSEEFSEVLNCILGTGTHGLEFAGNGLVLNVYEGFAFASGRYAILKNPKHITLTAGKTYWVGLRFNTASRVNELVAIEGDGAAPADTVSMFYCSICKAVAGTSTLTLTDLRTPIYTLAELTKMVNDIVKGNTPTVAKYS